MVAQPPPLPPPPPPTNPGLLKERANTLILLRSKLLQLLQLSHKLSQRPNTLIVEEARKVGVLSSN